jgi:hypothetical protein
MTVPAEALKALIVVIVGAGLAILSLLSYMF